MSQHTATYPVISEQWIAGMICSFRGKKVLLDSHLAALYGVPTKYLTRQVRRNLKRFPEDFMFQLTQREFLRCQNVTSKQGGRRYLPYAFTEQGEGVAMLSSVLHSEKAIHVNIQIMRAFVQFKRTGLTYAALSRKLDQLEKKYDAQFNVVFNAIRKLMAPPPPKPEKPKPKIGFHP